MKNKNKAIDAIKEVFNFWFFVVLLWGITIITIKTKSTISPEWNVLYLLICAIGIILSTKFWFEE